MKLIFVVMIGNLCCSIQSADRPDEPKKIDYQKLFRRSGMSDDQTSIYYYIEDKNSKALEDLITQATADKRLDVLENALMFAFREKKGNALEMLLRNGVPINRSIIKNAIDFSIEYALMGTKQQELYAKEQYIYGIIIRHIMRSNKQEDFKVLADYAISKGNRSVLIWLLQVAVSQENTQHAMELIDQYIENFDANDLHHSLQMLATMMNSADVQYRREIQGMIDRLNKALRNR